MDSGENMHFIVSRVKAIKSKSEESESHGWVKLEFYDNKGEGETDWLPILSETASNGCGFWSLPETGVQALACIFDGTKSGFVIGFLYDEKHKPPVKENEKACDRTILQTKNHRFELVDEEGKETISISTSKGKMRVVLASDGGIEIANKMKKGKIEIEAEELEIESENLIFDEYSTSIEAGVLEITNSNSVSLNTKKDFKVKGKNVKLNGSTGVTAKGRQIAKQDDKVFGMDTHILMVPSPSGAVPTPFSHPFVGALKEDLAASVKIWNNKVATKGSVAKHLAGHVPMGPGPFQKTPDNKGKVTGGTEKSVKANGKKVAVIGSSVTTCNDIGARDNSKILAAGMAINMPAIADPMKSEAYERARKKVSEEKKVETSEKTPPSNSAGCAPVPQKSDSDVVIYRRVQGGTGPKSSQVRIQVNDDGTISIPNKKANLNISIDNGEHSDYFLNKRGEDAYIVEMEVPKWFDDFLQETAIPQKYYRTNPLNQGGLAPKITDTTTPGKSFELPDPWVEWLEENCIHATIKKY